MISSDSESWVADGGRLDGGGGIGRASTILVKVKKPITDRRAYLEKEEGAAQGDQRVREEGHHVKTAIASASTQNSLYKY